MNKTTDAPTLRLAQFVADCKYDTLPAAVKAQLAMLFLDYFRVGSIGARMPWSDWATGLARKLGGTGGAWRLFSGERLDPVRATFLNATYTGSIDADDVHVGAMLHPGCIVFSAALAIGQDRDLSGARVMAAVAAGYEAMIRIALAIQPSHFRRGFQSTATCGAFGAGVAAASLLFDGADRARRIAETIGLAASFCGGLTQFYHSGSTVKRIHAAHAAAEGMQAALLAEAGFSGPTDILEGKDGFARAYADDVNFDLLTGGLGTDYRLMEVAVKPHACSARIQATIEATAMLCEQHGLHAKDIATARVGIPKVIQGRLTVNEPRDVQAAQMSVPFCVALTLARADALGPGFALNIDDFEEGMRDSAVLDLARRVACELDADVERVSGVESVGSRVTLQTASGASHGVFVETPKGSAARPFTMNDHADRFRHEAARRFDTGKNHALVAAIGDFAALPDVNALARMLAA